MAAASVTTEAEVPQRPEPSNAKGKGKGKEVVLGDALNHTRVDANTSYPAISYDNDYCYDLPVEGTTGGPEGQQGYLPYTSDRGSVPQLGCEPLPLSHENGSLYLEWLLERTVEEPVEQPPISPVEHHAEKNGEQPTDSAEA